MKGNWIARILCLLLIGTMVVAVGCNAFSAQRNRRRLYTVRTDLDRMVDDVDWVLGFSGPTKLYDETRP